MTTRGGRNTRGGYEAENDPFSAVDSNINEDSSTGRPRAHAVPAQKYQDPFQGSVQQDMSRTHEQSAHENKPHALRSDRTRHAEPRASYSEELEEDDSLDDLMPE